MTDTNANPNILIGFCLDESGSMQGIRQQTIDGFNEYINDLRKQEGETRISLTMFSDISGSLSGERDAATYRPYVFAADLRVLAPLTLDAYRPRGNTPLYDAIGHTVTSLASWLGAQPNKWTVLFVIQTDGKENASKEYTREQVFSLIREKEASGWKFIYLGADQDNYEAERISQGMGMSAGQTVSYAKSGTGSMYATVSAVTSSLRTDNAKSSAEIAREAKEEYERREKEKADQGTPSEQPNF